MTLRERLTDLQIDAASPTGVLTCSLLGSLADPAFRSLESELSCVRLKGGETLFTAGDPGDALYIVLYGRLRAFLPDGPNGYEALGEIGRGESVGEMAVLTGEPRSASVCAVRDTELLKLSKAGFERVVERQPQVMLGMARLIIARYQRVIRSKAQAQPVALAVVPCNRDVPIAGFARSLVQAMSPRHRVLSLDSEGLHRELDAFAGRLGADPERADLTGWLHARELQHDYVVYAADPAPTAWTRLCIRQADVVLLVGTSGAGAQPEPAMLDLVASDDSATRVRRELVLLYDGAQRMPEGTADWLGRVTVSAHHHVDPRVPRDFERLVRLLTGRAIGLVLGGGGARGLAHIGVIRAIEEADIPIDLVGGTSIGAVIGAQFASGWSSARIKAETRKVLVEGGSLNDYTLPIIALLHGRRFFRMLEKLYGDRRIEDLPRAFYCISTNLTRSTGVTHRTGPLTKGVAASMAVPGMGPPVFDGRDVLVDGGLVNNLPIDVMRGSGAGCVFASNASLRVEMRLDREYREFPLSPWRVLASWLNPFGTPMLVPTIQNILIRAVTLQHVTPGVAAQKGADLVFDPVQGHKFLEWDAFDSIVEGGYRTAAAALERWQAEGGPAPHGLSVTPARPGIEQR